MLSIRPHLRRAPCAAVSLLAAVLLVIIFLHNSRRTLLIDDGKWVIASGPLRKERPRLHFFLSALEEDVNTCKTLLSATLLGYPTPNLLSGNATVEERHNLTDIPRAAKIFYFLEHLDRLDPAADKDLVLVVESSDIWFQLKPETLIDRYVSVNAEANQRVLERMGGAAYSEGIKQSVIFGAGKSCIPNDPHSLACHAIPEYPLQPDSQSEQRYLSSGFAIGPVADMRVLFQRAAEKAQAWPTPDPDVQAVFSTIFGEQEFQREVLRRKHETIFDKLHTKASIRKTKSGSRTRSVANATARRTDVSIMTPQPGVSYEFGINLDYFSEIGHATADAKLDGQWLQYSDPLSTLQTQARSEQSDQTCIYNGNGELPNDILHSPLPFPIEAGPGVSLNKAWTQLPLYTNLCTGKIPALIQHNGNDSIANWPHLWFQPRARDLLQPKLYAENDREEGTEKGIKPSLEEPYEAESEDYATRLGAFTDDGTFRSWGRLCPSSFSAELFRD